MADHIKARGGEVRFSSPVAEMLTNPNPNPHPQP